MFEHLQIEYWPIERLTAYARNPRKNDHAVDRVAAAIREFGFRVPVVAKSDGTVVDGHLRLKAAQKLQLAEVPVVLADDLTDAQVKAFRISVNRMAELAEWDDELLALEVDELRGMNFDLELTGLDGDFLNRLLDTPPTAGTVPLCDPEEVPEPPEVPVTKPGDLIILGRHRLICGDSTDPAVVARLMAGKKADVVFTDPPYNVDYQGKTADALTIENDAMSDTDFYAFLLAAYRAMLEATKPGGPIYVCHADTEGANFRRAMTEAGWLFKQCIVWVKQSFVMGRQDYHWQHEPILYGWAPGAAHQWHGDRKQSTVWEFDRPQRNGEHPTMKPVELVSKALNNSSASGARVFDGFGGGGSTLIAAELTGRTAHVVELAPKYCDVIVERWERITGQKAERSA